MAHPIFICTQRLRDTTIFWVFRMGFALHSFMNFANPALRTIIPTISAAYVFQIAVAIPAVILQEDRYYGISD